MTAWSDAVAATSPYRWFKMNETSGVTATDSSGNGGTGNYNSTSDITYAQAALIPGDPGGLSAVMNANAANLTASSVSLSRIGASYATTFKSSTDQTGAFFRANSSTFLNIGASSSFANIAIGQTPSLGYDPTALFDGDEHLIIYIVKATSAELWVDGTMVGSGSHSASDSTLTSITVKGSSAGPTGAFDDLILWNTSLTSTQVGSLWAAWQGGSSVALNRASETDTARTLTPVVNSLITLGRASEVDIARALTAQVGIVQALGQASETDAARTLTPVAGFTGSLNRASETDLARPLTPVVNDLIALGRAAETDVAQTLTFAGGTAVPLNRATETDTARPIAAKVNVSLGRATSTEAARPFARLIVTDTTNRVGGRVRSGYAVATWTPPVADPDSSLIGPVQHDFDKAATFTAPTVTNGRAIAAPPTIAAAPRHRDRILVGNKDVTFFRGVHTPTPSFRLVEPGLYGAGELVMPQVHSLFEQVGTGALSFLAPQKAVRVQRVDVETGEVVAEDYVGFITGKPKRGAGSTFPLVGEITGRMAMDWQPRPVFRSVVDAGTSVFAAVRSVANRAFYPQGGPTTGIRLPRFGGMGKFEWFNELVGKMVHANGNQWAVGLRETGFNPDAGPVGTWGSWIKDRTTIHATAYIDGDWLVPDFGDDISERPNKLYVEAVDTEGRRIDFINLPGIKQGEAPDYPFNDERTFGQGTTDEDTDTGSGITSMVQRLMVMGWLSREDGADFDYDADTTAAIKRLQDEAGLSETGNMNVATWEALYDLSATHYTIAGSGILPAAQTSKVRLWNRTASGALSTRNPNYDAHEIVRARMVQMGLVKDKQQARQWARDALRDSSDQEWYGTLTCHFGLVRGEHNPGDAAITSADVMSARELRPGMNVWAPLFEGGTLFHVSAIEVPAGGRGVVLTLDTEARDTMEIWQIIQRNRESRQNLARAFVGQYLSSKVANDRLNTWNPEFGLIDDRVRLVPGWNHFPVAAGQAGTLEKVRIATDPPTEFVASVSAMEISDARMRHLIGNPLTEAGTERWETAWVRNALEDRIWLDSWGQHDQPAGYSPRKKTGDDGEATGATLTGVLEDAAGVGFHTFAGQPVLWVSIYVPTACSVKAGRLMWIQMEGSA